MNIHRLRLMVRLKEIVLGADRSNKQIWIFRLIEIYYGDLFDGQIWQGYRAAV